MKEETKTYLKPLAEKVSSDFVDNIEAAEPAFEKYITSLSETIEKHKNLFPKTNFYPIVLTVKDRAVDHLFKQIFTVGLVCPTPNYDQNVYKYYWFEDRLECLWVIPDKSTCKFYLRNKSLIDPKEYDLLGYVLAYKDGSLLKLAKKENGEKANSTLLEGKTCTIKPNQLISQRDYLLKQQKK